MQNPLLHWQQAVSRGLRDGSASQGDPRYEPSRSGCLSGRPSPLRNTDRAQSDHSRIALGSQRGSVSAEHPKGHPGAAAVPRRCAVLTGICSQYYCKATEETSGPSAFGGQRNARGEEPNESKINWKTTSPFFSCTWLSDHPHPWELPCRA